MSEYTTLKKKIHKKMTNFCAYSYSFHPQSTCTSSLIYFSIKVSVCAFLSVVLSCSSRIEVFLSVVNRILAEISAVWVGKVLHDFIINFELK